MIGQTISHYKIIEKIGHGGGMGVVYRAQDTNLSRELAIKVLPQQFFQDSQRLATFEREAKFLASLNHPNITAIYALEEEDDGGGQPVWSPDGKELFFRSGDQMMVVSVQTD